MNFAESLEYLHGALRFGIKKDLRRIRRLTELLGQPERNMRYIHVAGTNGKGSTTTYLAYILAQTGRRVGIFTSPYLARITERIRVIDGQEGLARLAADETAGEIGPEAFAEAMTRIRAASEQMVREGGEHPTEFEMLTAMGFLHFQATLCDIVVLEVGLGGRLDATNVIDTALASVITALGYDHMNILGHSLSRIAAEKAGIIKPGQPVFLYHPQDLELPAEEADAALRVIQDACVWLGAPLQLVRQSEIDRQSYGWSGQEFTDRRSGICMYTRLLGRYQPMNATLAARMCQCLGLASDSDIAAGIAAARWPARLELLRQTPPVLLDGAHNPQGCGALTDTLEHLLPGRPILYLTAVSADKNYPEMMDITLRRSACLPVGVYVTQADSPRALPAGELAVVVRKALGDRAEQRSAERRAEQTNPVGERLDAAIPVQVIENPEEAACQALAEAIRQNVALCVFGTLFLVGSVRPILSAVEESHGLATAD